MKTQIRTGMFETNSSSVHALIIPKECDEQRHKLYVSHGEFGWECERYKSPDTLLSYLCQAVYDTADSEARYKHGIKDEKLVREYVEGVLSNFVAPIKECGIDVEFVDNYFACGYENGYVDHARTLVEEELPGLISNRDKMMRFIFGGELITGNDNDDDECPKTDWHDNEKYDVVVKYN